MGGGGSGASTGASTGLAGSSARVPSSKKKQLLRKTSTSSEESEQPGNLLKSYVTHNQDGYRNTGLMASNDGPLKQLASHNSSKLTEDQPQVFSNHLIRKSVKKDSAATGNRSNSRNVD